MSQRHQTNVASSGKISQYEQPQEKQALVDQAALSDGTSCNPFHVFRVVSNGIGSLASTTSNLFFEFNGVMKEILPELSDEEQGKVREAFTEYQSMLMTTQTFITRTTLRVNHAKTQEDFIKAIDIDTLVRLCDIVLKLLPKFWHINTIVDKKLKEERKIKRWRNIGLGVFAFCGGVVVIATACGAAFGFTAAVKGVLLIGGATGIVGLTAAGIAQIAQNLTAFEQVMKNLTELKALLSQLCQRYSDLQGYHGELNEESKQEFLGILKEAKKEVTKGFEILGRF